MKASLPASKKFQQASQSENFALALFNSESIWDQLRVAPIPVDESECNRSICSTERRWERVLALQILGYILP